MISIFSLVQCQCDIICSEVKPVWGLYNVISYLCVLFMIQVGIGETSIHMDLKVYPSILEIV